MQQIEMRRRVAWENQLVLQQLHSLPSGSDTIPQAAPSELGGHIISPYDFRYRWWQNFLIPWVIYTAWVSPFEAGFLLEPIPLLSTFNNIINVFFTIDIALTFLVAYKDKHTNLLVDDPKKIAFKYLSTWFIFDVSSTIPFQALALLFTGKYASGLTFNLLHILRLWRLRKVSALFARLEKDIRINYFWLRCAKIICTTFFSMHCAGCCFHLIASRYKEPQNTWIANSISSNISEISLWERYVAAIYWALTTLSTVGYGDIHPKNAPEMIFDSVYMIFSLGLGAYLIGNMTNLFVEDSSRTRRFRSMVTAASTCASRNNLPEELQKQIIDFLSLKFRSEGYQQIHILDSLSNGLRLNIRQYLFLPILEKTYLFQGVSYSLLLQLVSEIQVVYFPAKHDVILQNEAPTNLYIVVSGAVELIFQSGGIDEVSSCEFQKLEKVDTGDIFGEYGVLCNRPQAFWARTKKVSELLMLGRKAVERMLESYLEDKQIVMTNLFQIRSQVQPCFSGP